MKKRRLKYFSLIVVTILLGLISRRIGFIPAVTGDVLWAIMVFLMIRFLFIYKSLKFVALISVSFCYLIEMSQLYHEPWIDRIRNTTFGALVLGHGFLWSDVLVYTLGVCLCVLAEWKLHPTVHSEKV